ncbi:serine palmitoyltransferase [Emiliania huxleyi virus 201]|nr:serine palmitoyltransferase [Emiliania huxleyi virus 203]AEP15594.1 serine palmitoyltransferase [Emiliania huxleyi virus 207]AEP16020.1 serine palmitoyltransferase [Emiliania huxleyi virus 208]AET97936.1 serine palmitoyltransferase [Emiliania huxleyi virus 201]
MYTAVFICLCMIALPTFVNKYAKFMTIVFAFSKIFIKSIFQELFSGNYLSGNTGLTSSKNELFYRHIFTPIKDCWSRPIHGHASTVITVQPENGDKPCECINMGSYNYLGFGGIDKTITSQVKQAIETYGVASTSVRDGSENDLQSVLETKIATFLNKDAAVVIGMGFATNTSVIPVLLTDGVDPKNVLVLSDSFNHASIVEGIRLSGAKVKVFKHNNALDLEDILLRETSCCNWDKIVVFVEGIYSMEGDFCNLNEIVQVKTKYGAHLYLDEAHSIGATGPTGRGVAEHFNINTSNIDVMMGTFTKSFGSVGGYVCASQPVINCIRATATACVYSPGMSHAAVMQALVTLEILIAGSKKPMQLRENANYFRKCLMEMKYPVLGDVDSPIIPFLIERPDKLVEFSRKCLARGVAIVIVGYPATPFLESRARFCISSEHTREQLDYVLMVIDETSRELKLRKVSGYAESKKTHDFHSDVVLNPPSDLVSNLWNTVSVKKIETTTEFTTTSFLNMHKHPDVIVSAKNAIDVYSCGTCGPRGFYGTLDIHMDLESTLATKLNVEKAIIYSYGLVVVSSVVKAFAKPNDFLIYDELVSTPVKSGIVLSRASKLSFKHNDISSLVEQLEYAKQLDPNGDATVYVLVEGVYANIGDIVNLPCIIALRSRYKFCLICDDSYGFGLLGKHRLGTPDHYNVPHSEVDLYIGSFEHAIGSVGGFCAGVGDMISHQALNGSGYCFSASLPAYCTSAIRTSLDVIERDYDVYHELNNVMRYTSVMLGKLSNFSRVDVDLSITPLYCIYIRDNDGMYNIELLEKIKHDVAKQHGIRIDVVKHPKQPGIPTANPFIKFNVDNDQDLGINGTLNVFVKFMIEYLS